jgi:hypothetical protein
VHPSSMRNRYDLYALSGFTSQVRSTKLPEGDVEVHLVGKSPKLSTILRAMNASLVVASIFAKTIEYLPVNLL